MHSATVDLLLVGTDDISPQTFWMLLPGMVAIKAGVSGLARECAVRDSALRLMKVVVKKIRNAQGRHGRKDGKKGYV